MLHIFSSKFYVENDARNESFKKQLLGEILMFFLSSNSTVSLIRKPDSTSVKSLAKRWPRLDKFIKRYFSSHCSFHEIKFSRFYKSTAKRRKKKKKMQNTKKTAWLKIPCIKPFSVCDLTHADFGFSCERYIRIFRDQCKTMIKLKTR